VPSKNATAVALADDDGPCTTRDGLMPEEFLGEEPGDEAAPAVSLRVS